MATPRSYGLESMVYAVGKEATTIGEAKYITRAHDLEQRLKDQWVPIFSAGGISDDTSTLATDMASETGRSNCLDVDDVYGAVGTTQQEAFVSGDVGAGVSAAAQDVGSAASEDAAAVASAAAAAGSAVTSGVASTLKWAVVAVVAVALIFVLSKSRG